MALDQIDCVLLHHKRPWARSQVSYTREHALKTIMTTTSQYGCYRVIIVAGLMLVACGLVSVIESKQLPLLSRTNEHLVTKRDTVNAASNTDTTTETQLANEIIDEAMDNIDTELTSSCPRMATQSQAERIKYYLDRVSSKLYERLSKNPQEAQEFFQSLDISLIDISRESNSIDPVVSVESDDDDDDDRKKLQSYVESNEDAAYVDKLNWQEIEDDYIELRKKKEKPMDAPSEHFESLEDQLNKNIFTDTNAFGHSESSLSDAKKLPERAVMSSLLAAVRSVLGINGKVGNSDSDRVTQEVDNTFHHQVNEHEKSSDSYATADAERNNLPIDGDSHELSNKLMSMTGDSQGLMSSQQPQQLQQPQRLQTLSIKQSANQQQQQNDEKEKEEGYSFYDDLDMQYWREYQTITSIMYAGSHLFTNLASYTKVFDHLPLIGATLKHLRSIGFRFVDYVKMMKHVERDYINLTKQDSANIKSLFLLNCKWLTTLILNITTGTMEEYPVNVEAVILRLFWVLGIKIVGKLLKCSIPQLKMPKLLSKTHNQTDKHLAMTTVDENTDGWLMINHA